MKRLLEEHRNIMAELAGIMLAIEELEAKTPRDQATEELQGWKDLKERALFRLDKNEALLEAKHCHEQIKELKAEVLRLSQILQKPSPN